MTDMVAEECEDTYIILDELEEQLAEACNEQTEWREEIDRQNLRTLLDDLDAVHRVRLLVQEIVDPRTGPPTENSAALAEPDEVNQVSYPITIVKANLSDTDVGRDPRD